METRLEKLHRIRRLIDIEIARIEEGCLNPDAVVSFASRWFRRSYVDIISPSRESGVNQIRQIIAKELRKRGNTYQSIGSALGDRDHSTVINMISVYDSKFNQPTWEKFSAHAKLFSQDLQEYENIKRLQNRVEAVTGQFSADLQPKTKTFE